MNKNLNYYKEIGWRLKKVREFYDMNQVDFAKNADLSNSQYNNWETGKQRLSLSGALRIKSKYDVSLDYLYLGILSALSINMRNALSSSPRVNASNKSSDRPET